MKLQIMTLLTVPTHVAHFVHMTPLSGVLIKPCDLWKCSNLALNRPSVNTNHPQNCCLFREHATLCRWL